MFEKIRDAGFTFADLSAEPGLPDEICAACAVKGLRHVSGLLAAYCSHSLAGAIRVAPRPWRVVGSVDVVDFYYDVLRGPGLASAALAPDRDPHAPVH